jgi:hypothetical protein
VIRAGRSRLLAAVALVAVLVPSLWPVDFVNSDRWIFWYAGRMVLDGNSPYDQTAWIAGAAQYGSTNIDRILGLGAVVWLYPPHVAYLLAPFGALPPAIASVALHLSFLAAGYVAAFMLVRARRWWRPAAFTLALCAVAVFEPLVISSRWGQSGGLTLLGIALALTSLAQPRALPFAASGLLLSLKPHLTVIFALAVFIALVRDRAWRSVAAFAGVPLAVGVASLALDPHALGFILDRGGEQASHVGLYASVWSLAYGIGGPGWVTLGAVFALLTAALSFGAAGLVDAGRRREWILAAAACVSLLTSPYQYSYDHTMLVPALVLSLGAAGSVVGALRVTHLWIAVLLALGLPWLLFLLSYLAPVLPSVSGAVPLLFGLLLLVSARAVRRGGAEIERAPILSDRGSSVF